MLTRRNLRNRIIIVRSNKELKKNLSKLDDEENQLISPNLMKHRKVRGNEKDKPLCSSVLKNSKNKPVGSILTKRNSQENISVNPPGNKSLHERNCRRQTVKQNSLHKSKLSVLQEINGRIKGSINSNTKKQKENIENVKQENNKKYDKHNCEIESLMSACNHQPEKSKEKGNGITSEIETSVLKNAAKFPIWKRQPNLNKPINLGKQSNKIDVYDIALDEELIASEILSKKNQACFQKRKINKGIKKKCLSSKTKNYKSISASNTLDVGGKRKALEKEQTTSYIINNKKAMEEKENEKFSNQIMNNVTSDLHDNNGQDLFISTSLQMDEQNRSLEHSSLGLQTSEPKSKSELLSDLADELEKSILMPKMTSTPDAVHDKPGVHIQKSGILNITEISNIATTNKNITVATPYHTESYSEEETKNKGNMADITLFESPTKEEKEKKEIKSPKKLIQINLFGEILNSPLNENLEDSVLKPNKAYHTPDHFKTHLVRTKRTAEVSKTQIFKRSKEDILIEKMTRHFDEVNGTELFIE